MGVTACSVWQSISDETALRTIKATLQRVHKGASGDLHFEAQGTKQAGYAKGVINGPTPMTGRI